MRKTKVVYLDGSHERELVIPPELLFDSEKKEKFIKDHIGNVDYVERRYYDEADEDIDVLPAQTSDNSNINDNSENVSELPPSISVQPSVETLTAEIKMYLHFANQSIIEVGKRLIQAKEMLPHGEWKNWLKQNFSLSIPTAQKYMQIYNRFGISRIDTAFGSTQLIALLALPEGTEENFLALKSSEGNPADQMNIKQLRAKGKFAELTCSFCSNISTLKAFGADKLRLSDSDMEDNSNICKLWRNVDSVAFHSVNFKSPTVSYNDLRFETVDVFFWRKISFKLSPAISLLLQ